MGMSVFATDPATLPPDCRVYCIVLEGDDVKRGCMEDEFRAHGLLPHVEWVVRARDEEDGVRGCFESHQEACARAMRVPNLKAAIIVEDDCTFASNSTCSVIDGIRDVVDAIRGGCIACGIGGVPLSRYGARVHSSLWCMDCSWVWTHCYALSVTGCIWMKSRKFRGKHYDAELQNVPGRSALLTHSVAYQRGGYATTTGNSALYRFSHTLREMVSPRTCQRVMHRAMMLMTRATCRYPAEW